MAHSVRSNGSLVVPLYQLASSLSCRRVRKNLLEITSKNVTTIEDIQKELQEIKSRNKRVEADKAWETSWTRKVIILVLTYIVIVIFFFVSNLGNPFINAIVPTIGFFLSTLTVPIIKKWWLKKQVKAT